MNKKIFCLILPLALLVSITVSQAFAAEAVIQLGYTGQANDNNYSNQFGTRLAKNIEAATNGRLKIQPLPGGQLGGERDMIEGMQLGTVDMAIINNSSVSNFFPPYLVYDLPYLYKDAETAFKVLDSDLAKRLSDETFAKHGVKILAQGSGGFRQIINNLRPVREPKDLRNMKFRVPEAPISLAAFKALGTNSAILAWPEVTTAIQQKTIDGLELTSAMVYSNGIHEMISYLSMTNHFFNPIDLIISKSAWDNLAPDLQATLQKTAQETAVEQRAFATEYEASLRKLIIDAGVKINDDVNIAAFQELCIPVWEVFRAQIGGDVLDEVLELTK